MADPYLMKGKVYGERKHLLTFPVYAEVKYDEIRLHAKAVRGSDGYVTSVEFLSYAGKPLANMEMWESAFSYFFHRHPNINHLDMGVMVNGNFNDSYRWVRSTKGIPGEKFDKATGKTHPKLTPRMVQFYLFDVPEFGAKFEERKFQVDTVANVLADIMQGHGPWPSEVRRPNGWVVDNEAALETLFIAQRELGWEGLMVKTLDHTYQRGKRIDGWLKMKPESEADGVITGLNRAVSIEGVPLDRIGSIDVTVYEELIEDRLGGTGTYGSYASPAGIPHELGADMFLHPDKYLGCWVEFKFMERDRQGGYRHPSFVRFREGKQ